MRGIFNVGGCNGYKRFDYVIKKGGNVFCRTGTSTHNGPNARGILMKLSQEIHALGPYIITWFEVCMCVCVYVTCFVNAIN